MLRFFANGYKWSDNIKKIQLRNCFSLIFLTTFKPDNNMKNITFYKNSFLWMCLCLVTYISPTFACLDLPQNPPDMEITPCVAPDNMLYLRFKNYDTYGANPGEYCACALNLPLTFGQVVSASIVHAGTNTPVNGWSFTANPMTQFPSPADWQGFSSAVDQSIAQGLPVDLIFCIIPSCEQSGQPGCCDGGDIANFFQNNPPVIGTGGADEQGVPIPGHHIAEMPIGNIQLQGEGNVGIGTSDPQEDLHVVGNPIESTIAVGLTPNNLNGQIRTLCMNGQSDRIDVDINVEFDEDLGFMPQNPDFNSWCNSMSSTLGGAGSSFEVAFAPPGGGPGTMDWIPYMRIDEGGNMKVWGDVMANCVTTPSDTRFKENINTIENALEQVNQLRGVSYKFNQTAFPNKNFSAKNQIGFIAQEIQTVFPELVNTDKSGYLSVNYTAVIPVLTEAVKELNTENQYLKQQLKNMEERMAEIEALLKKK